jgi:beta-aspartyl-peptidase (threonine type)
LEKGEISALQAVTIAVQVMEDEPLFNAGRGSVLDSEGNVSMDASIMAGIDGAAGACAGLSKTRHPIALARHLLDNGWPVMMIGEGAEDEARKAGLEMVEHRWLKTDLRQAQWSKWKATNDRPGSTDEDDDAQSAILDHDSEIERTPVGTVGAVAIDVDGEMAAATSTGGMTGKPPGRLGDSALIGAGTWADQRVAVSCTGIGEAYIRTAAARRFADLFELTEMTLAEVGDRVLEEVAPLGGRGGLIALNSHGEFILPFHTTLMYRGVWADGKITTAIGPD